MLMSVLQNESGPPLDVVCLNAAAALYAANVVENIRDGLILAKQTIESGAALNKLKDMVSLTQKLTLST